MAPNTMTLRSSWGEDFFGHNKHHDDNMYSERKRRTKTARDNDNDDDGYFVGEYYIPKTYTGTVDEVPTGVNRGAPVTPSSSMSSSYNDNDWGWTHSPIVTNRHQHRNAHPSHSARPSDDSFFSIYSVLKREKPYRHAQKAGTLWQTLVGQHVRFPSHWWNGARSPAMGLIQNDNDVRRHSPRRYNYIARHKLYDNPTFGSLVPSRGSPGRLLLHVVIRDSSSGEAIQDVAIGCFHPNARGIRKTEHADERQRGCREVWMATRKRLPPEEDYVSSVIDPLLTRGRDIAELANESPLGSKSGVSNQNMREVFGEKPPLQTIFITEIQLNEIMLAAEETESFAAPALVLLREYLFP